MAVATYGAVRGVAPAELRALGAQILLANTYHLHERPGEDRVAGARRAPRLHRLARALAHRQRRLPGHSRWPIASSVDEDGVTFASPLDGRRRLLTPESAVAIQEALGADIAMVLDECFRRRSPGTARARPRRRGPGDLRDAMERTLRWGERCAAAQRRAGPGALRHRAGRALAALRRASARGTAEPRLRRLRPWRARPRRGAARAAIELVAGRTRTSRRRRRAT